MEEKKNQVPAIEFLWLSLYAFAGFSVELLQGMVLGELPKGIGNLITALLWGGISVGLILLAKKKFGLDLAANQKSVPAKNHLLIIACVLVVILLTTVGFKGFKPLMEFRGEAGGVAFVYLCRLVYYLAESALIFLTIAFGQKFADERFNLPDWLPAGGVILALTWGSIHFLLQGFSGGLFTMAFAVIAGMIYLLARKNSRWSYFYIALAFIL